MTDITTDLICLIVGLSGGYLLSWRLSKKKINESKKQIWQAQDTKLMASIASDKEKQLEAKIATLEAALKNALKKHTS